MNKEQLLSHIKECHNTIHSLIEKKNSDYSKDNDAFANFRYVEMLGLSAEQAILFRILDKIARINNLLTKDALVVSESLEDSILDAAGYFVLLSGLIKDRKSIFPIKDKKIIKSDFIKSSFTKKFVKKVK